MSATSNIAYIDATAVSRLRWRCRRGFLENDLLIAKYFATHSECMTEDDAQALEALMDLSDNDLLALLLGTTKPTPALSTPHILSVLKQLQSASAR